MTKQAKEPFKQFETGALRDRPPGKGMYAAISPVAIDRLAKRLEYGHIKYGDCRNWEKGMPVSEFITSSLRHIFQYLDGDNAEDHLAAAFWNLHCAMHMEVKKPEMMDIPARMKIEK
ncbi:dATP/dGTP diphosphohydrolase domain-containing protein [Paenibacillus camelliae]|uniref:dATP/dGTP diphosphohydrolase domain-containing protein n=1 Tax=Paenibacillus camelliae TaxID=512410 RepID=UPI00203E8446|nr:dATP/dGTP diphosphohydrolase domain-containing protein [Paenibacillus camelliae]MCM3632874.1 DUF5664 domain-containing protein [Paenibacillus camelliae]